jgi:hypothetical protein
MSTCTQVEQKSGVKNVKGRRQSRLSANFFGSQSNVDEVDEGCISPSAPCAQESCRPRQLAMFRARASVKDMKINLKNKKSEGSSVFGESVSMHQRTKHLRQSSVKRRQTLVVATEHAKSSMSIPEN